MVSNVRQNRTLKAYCCLWELENESLSLKDIQQIINDTDNNILKSLIVNQRRKLKQEIKDASEQLASLSQLETFLNKHSDFPGNISQSIFDKIKKTKERPFNRDHQVFFASRSSERRSHEIINQTNGTGNWLQRLGTTDGYL